LAKVSLPIKRLAHGKDIPLPKYMSAGAAGMDLYAACDKPIELEPMEIALIPTGISIAVPEGYEAQIRPRSGLASKHGLSLVNSPGTIDADYRGEIKLILINMGEKKVTIEKGQRAAQMVICPIVQAVTVEVDSLEKTARGHGGFGHTGK